MGLGLQLRASFAGGAPDDPLGAVVAWAHAALPAAGVSADRDGPRPSVRLALHPAAEPVELSLLETGQLEVSAATSGAGPGYHAFVVEQVLDPLAQTLSLRWEPGDDEGDETGYFEARDPDELERQMLVWLGAVAAWLLREGGKDPETEFGICLPLESGFTMRAFSRTPLGPRDRAYWEAVAEDPRRGIDFFAWWEPGQGAEYWRGVALALMWMEARWCPPDRDEDEAILRRIVDALARAHELDPACALPWRAWGEILDLLGEDGPLADEVRGRAADAADEPVGYRRHPVRVTLADGWSMRVPGALCEDLDDEGAWWMHGDGREVWFTAFSRRRSDAPAESADRLLADLARDGTVRTWKDESEGRAAAAALRESDGTWILGSMVAIPGHAALATFVLRSEDDVAWALEAWRSLERSEPDDFRVE